MTATAAGVTPGIREAWPSVAGVSVKALDHFAGQTWNPVELESPLESTRSPVCAADHGRSLPSEIALVLELRLDARDVDRGIARINLERQTDQHDDQARQVARRAASARVEAGNALPPIRVQPCDRAHGRRVPLEARAAARRNRSQRSSSTRPACATPRREPKVGVVDPQEQPVLRARREHPVRLQAALRRQVVDEDADVSLVAAEA